MKKLCDFTLNEFVDKLVSWIHADDEENGAPFKKKLEKKGIKKQNLVPTLLQPIIAASDYAKSDKSIFEYCEKHTDLKDIESLLASKCPKTDDKTGDKRSDKPRMSILQSFTYRLVINSCSLQLNDASDNSTSSALRAFFPEYNLRELGKLIRGATTVGAAFKELTDKFISTEPISKNPDLSATARQLLDRNPEEATTKDIYHELVDLFFYDDDKEYMEAPKMREKSYTYYKKEVTESIKNGAKQIILTGAPGTGKTKMAKEVAEEIVRDRIEEAAKENKLVDDYIEFVQFHPSYDYTDFVEGLRPVEVKLEVKSQSTEEVKSEVKSQPTEGAQKEAEHQSIAKSEIVFKRVDGIFKAFCRKVIEENKSENKYFFLIDEINRADLSKVFGELMYCLESDKRGEKNSVKTPYHNLNIHFPDDPDKTNDVFKDGFYIPDNVYIIGTMNDIDRSVESMDFALRRRFMFIEIEVTKPLLKGAFEVIFKRNKIKEKAEELAMRVMKMNEVMTAPAYRDFGLNKQYYISQGQFANLPDNAFTGNSDDITSILDFVWKYRIEPLLREYVRGEEQDKVDKFITACKKALTDPVGGQNTSKDTANNAQAENGES